MKCQQCQKLATRRITEILGPAKFEEYQLCDECTARYLHETSKKSSSVTSDLPQTTDKQCDICGTKFVDFRNTGRLGCPHDYREFQAELEPLLDSIHSATRHSGKSPRRPSQQSRARELADLRKSLQDAVTQELYEVAARVRDRIRQLEEKN